MNVNGTLMLANFHQRILLHIQNIYGWTPKIIIAIKRQFVHKFLFELK